MDDSHAIAWFAWLLTWFLDLASGSSFDPDTRPEPLLLAVVVGGLGSGALSQVLRYRRAGPPGRRRQTRWVVVGMLGAVLGFGLLWAALLIVPDLRARNAALPSTLFAFVFYLLPWLLIPLSMVYSMVRHGLWAANTGIEDQGSRIGD